MKFKDILTKQILEEGAGTLSGLPKNIIKEIVSGTFSGLGGENSKIELYKKKAKQSDVSAAAKMVGGYVAPTDRGYSRYSKEELKARENKANYAGVLIKINDEYAFYAKYDEYGDGAKKFQLISAEGVVARKESKLSKTRFGYKYDSYDRKYLASTEIGDIIDFKENDVDVYLITADQERLAKREERKQGIVDPRYVSEEKKKAILKFINSRSGDILESIRKDIQESAQDINEKVNLNVNSILTSPNTNGEFKTIDIREEINILNDKIKSFNSLGYYLNQVIKDGVFEKSSWKDDKKTYAYKTFMELVDNVNQISY